MRYGVAMARRGWLRRGEVLNTLPRGRVPPRGPARGRGVTPRIFLLSPAHCGGERARLVFNDAGAVRPGACGCASRAARPLGEVFTFLSGLYFRGKLAYARAFAAAARRACRASS